MNLLSANGFNLVQSKILLFGKEIKPYSFYGRNMTKIIINLFKLKATAFADNEIEMTQNFEITGNIISKKKSKNALLDFCKQSAPKLTLSQTSPGFHVSAVQVF